MAALDSDHYRQVPLYMNVYTNHELLLSAHVVNLSEVAIVLGNLFITVAPLSPICCTKLPPFNGLVYSVADPQSSHYSQVSWYDHIIRANVQMYVYICTRICNPTVVVFYLYLVLSPLTSPSG